jgi:hypothetical protein
VGLAALLAWTSWPEANRVFDLPLLMTAALCVSFQMLQRSSAKVVMQPSFVIEFATLVLLGANAATLVAAAGILMNRLVNPRKSKSLTLVRIGSVTAALQAAGLVHRALGGSLGHFTWPAQALPITAATMM